MNTKEAIVQEALDTSYLYRENAYLKHGVAPKPERNKITEKKIKKLKKAIPIQQNQVIPMPQADKTLSPDFQNSLQKLLKKLLIAGTIIGGAGGIGGLSGFVANKMSNKSEERVISSPVNGNLMEWLENNGYNLPPADK